MTRAAVIVLVSLTLGAAATEDSTSVDQLTEAKPAVIADEEATESDNKASPDEEGAEEDEYHTLEPLSEGEEKIQSNADVALPQDI